ncbi:immunoglobulin-like domain-containing protein [Ornithinibacillus salinisoli]|uniref:Immunoglobulin-like domain-containing protein n=1 Tax=Ornithinibacillus salinisoli TaxID=1848459 RepID=A0ABW4W3Q1_9BACI
MKLKWMNMLFSGKLYLIGIGSIIFCMLAGCSQIAEDETDWPIGQGELQNHVGEELNKTNNISKSIFFNDTELWKRTDYDEPTGNWFFHEGEGHLGYGLTSGSQKPGEDFIVKLIGHEEEGLYMDRDIRVQLTLLDEQGEEKERIIDETIHVDTVLDEELVYESNLPDIENVSYYLSSEILNKHGLVEDTRVSFIYVPAEEMNVVLQTDKQNYNKTKSTAKLIVKNYGPTILSLDKYYTIEKKVNGTWRIVPLTLAFEDIALYLDIEKEYEQSFEISELTEGDYRIIKEVRTDGHDVMAVLAAEFSIID